MERLLIFKILLLLVLRHFLFPCLPTRVSSYSTAKLPFVQRLQASNLLRLVLQGCVLFILSYVLEAEILKQGINDGGVLVRAPCGF